MTDCPVCGYSEEKPFIPSSYEELRKNMLHTLFGVHLARTWWLKQPEFVCGWLKDAGLSPKNLVDIGCGDGRWLPGILRVFPDVHYVGVDVMPEHIELNQERFPDTEWRCGDFTAWRPGIYFDTALVGGTLNPKMDDEKQDRLLKRIVELGPKRIVCLFDNSVSGVPPDKWFEGHYQKFNTLEVPEEFCGPRQDVVVWLYGK